MPDYGHDLQFGAFVTPRADQAHHVVALAQLADQVGLDLVTVQDHPYQARFLDTWTLLSVIAATTSRVRVAPNVANLPLRQPVVLARSAATLDLLSGGRVELGLGAGAFWDAIAAVGGPRLTAAQAVTALEEGLRVIRGVWGGETVRLMGEHYQVSGARPGPPPAHAIEIWLGAYKRRMLALTGRLADGWLPSQGYAGPEALAAMNLAIDEAAQQAGREPRAVRRLYNVNGTFSGGGRGFLQGAPQVWAEQLAELTLTEGTSVYILASDSPEDLRRYAAEVAPAVRELVAAERSGSRRAGSQQPTPEQPTSEQPTSERATPQRPAPGLGVTPTPDDRVRRSTVRLWDEQSRPSGPAPERGRRYSPAERASGQHLVDVHDHLRQELARLRDLVEQVAAGSLDAGTARSSLNAMTMRQNNWTLGTYCESYCRVVATHHTIEDQSVFPHLRRTDPGLVPVLDRLAEEHLVIHDVLERVDRALVRLVSEGAARDAMAALRGEVDLLTDTLLSHLSYEEHELVEPLARLGFS